MHDQIDDSASTPYNFQSHLLENYPKYKIYAPTIKVKLFFVYFQNDRKRREDFKEASLGTNSS